MTILDAEAHAAASRALDHAKAFEHELTATTNAVRAPYPETARGLEKTAELLRFLMAQVRVVAERLARGGGRP